jgi:hypothetical protein
MVDQLLLISYLLLYYLLLFSYSVITILFNNIICYGIILINRVQLVLVLFSQ